jgi:uncharacterized membrane protein
MPIFKRYYIADIPGLGWLAKFYITHYIHYIGAVLLLAFIAYRIAEYMMVKHSTRKLTASGYIRGMLLGGITITGIFLVIRNLHGIWLSPGFIIFLDITHLGLVMIFIPVISYCGIQKKPWTQAR